MRKTIILIILIISLFSPEILATPPKLAPCEIVDNPDFYKNLAFNSEEYKYFKEWKLIDSSIPCKQYITTNLYLTFELPSDYSLNNYKYKIKVVFSFLNNELANKEEISRIFNNFKQTIINFENNEEIKLFNNLANIQLIENSQEITYRDRNSVFEVKSLEDTINYDFLENKIEGFVFYNKNLINNANSFFPKFNDISQIKEFKENKNIEKIEYGFDRISISENKICPTCKSYVIINLIDNKPDFFNLNNNVEWKTFSEIKTINKVLQDYLLDNKIECDIDKSVNSYIISGKDSTIVKVNCFDGTRKEAFLRLDESKNYKVEGLDIYTKSFDDFGAKIYPFLLIRYILILVIIIFLIIGLIVYIKKRKNG